MANLFKFYFDFMSPVSRPLWILLEHSKVGCEKISVALRKGEHLAEGYAKDVNRFNKVPAISDNGYKLSESVAIFHYLGRRDVWPERWYPKDSRSLAKIDEYLQWQHTNLFVGAGMLFYMQWVTPFRTGQKPNQEEIEQQVRTLNKNLNDLENIWLRDNKYLTGHDVTFADLMAVSIIEQVTGLRLFKVDEVKHPRVNKWMEEVREFFGENFKLAHQVLHKYGEKFGGKL